MKETYLGVKVENKGHYAPGVISNGMLHISGLLSIDLDTRRVPDGGIEEHMKLSLYNMGRVLHAAGLHFGCLVEIEAIAEVNES